MDLLKEFVSLLFAMERIAPMLMFVLATVFVMDLTLVFAMLDIMLQIAQCMTVLAFHSTMRQPALDTELVTHQTHARVRLVGLRPIAMSRFAMVFLVQIHKFAMDEVYATIIINVCVILVIQVQSVSSVSVMVRIAVMQQYALRTEFVFYTTIAPVILGGLDITAKSHYATALMPQAMLFVHLMVLAFCPTIVHAVWVTMELHVTLQFVSI